MSTPKTIMLDLDGPVFNLRCTLAETYSMCEPAQRRQGAYDHALVDLIRIFGAAGHRVACISSRRSDPAACLRTLDQLQLVACLHKHWLVPHPGHAEPGLFKAGWCDNRGALVRKWCIATKTPLASVVAIDDQPEEYVEDGSTRVTVIAALPDDGVPASGLQKLVTFCSRD